MPGALLSLLVGGLMFAGAARASAADPSGGISANNVDTGFRTSISTSANVKAGAPGVLHRPHEGETEHNDRTGPSALMLNIAKASGTRAAKEHEDDADRQAGTVSSSSHGGIDDHGLSGRFADLWPVLGGTLVAVIGALAVGCVLYRAGAWWFLHGGRLDARDRIGRRREGIRRFELDRLLDSGGAGSSGAPSPFRDEDEETDGEEGGERRSARGQYKALPPKPLPPKPLPPLPAEGTSGG